MFNNLISAFDWTTGLFIGLLAVMVIILVVLPMFTNKKRNKAVNELHSSLRPGDVIKTVGGVIGTITAIREISPVDKEMVIETGEGNNKSSLVFDVQAVYQVISKANDPAASPFEEVKAESADVAAPIVDSAPVDSAPAIDTTSNVADDASEVVAKKVTAKKTANK